MKVPTRVLFAAAAAAGLAAVPSARGALVLQYNFNNGNVLAPTDTSGAGHNGTARGPSSIALATSPGGSPAANFTEDQTAGGIDTNTLTSTLGITSSWTGTALVNLNNDAGGSNNTGDDMIFGTNVGGDGTGELHVGFRNNNLQFGYWGNDTGPDQGAATTFPMNRGEWHRVTFRYDAANGEQAAFLDGTKAFGVTGHAAYLRGDVNLLIGYAGGNSGAFGGLLDDVRVYNNALSDAEIAALPRQDVVPEPATFGLAGLAVTGLLVARGRRPGR